MRSNRLTGAKKMRHPGLWAALWTALLLCPGPLQADPCDETGCEGPCDAFTNVTTAAGDVFRVGLLGVEFDGTRTTFTYQVCRTSQADHDLSHWVLGLSCECADRLVGADAAQDPTTGLFGTKFETDHGVGICTGSYDSPGRGVSVFTVSFEGDMSATGCVQISAKSSGAPAPVEYSCIQGPSCAGCEDEDGDDDGVNDCDDHCPDTPEDEEADEDGCSCSQLDGDDDGVNDCDDQCPDSPEDEQADEDGCSCSQLDADDDGVNDCDDHCPDTPEDEQANENGCSCSQLDGDDDGVNDCDDQCPDSPEDEQADEDGCPPCMQDDVPPVIRSCPTTLTLALDANCELGEIGWDHVEACDDCTAEEDLVITDDLGEVVFTADDENQLITVEVQDQVFTIEYGEAPISALGEVEVTIWVADASGNTASCTVMVTLALGDCPPPVPVPPPPPPPTETRASPDCDPDEFGLNLLFSTLFRAPVCGLGCPLTVVMSIFGMGVLKFRRRRRRYGPLPGQMAGSPGRAPPVRRAG